MAIERWSPAREMASLREVMDRLFEEAFVSPRRMMERERWTGVDVYEQNDNYIMEMPLPGARPEDVNISVAGNTVTIDGEVPCPSMQEGGPTYLVHERPCGKFHRTLTLPTEIDANNAQAAFEHGVLRLTMPKTEAARAKRIKVSGTRA